MWTLSFHVWRCGHPIHGPLDFGWVGLLDSAHRPRWAQLLGIVQNSDHSESEINPEQCTSYCTVWLRNCFLCLDVARVRATPIYSSNFAPLSPKMRVPHLYLSSYFSAHSNRFSKTFLLYTILSCVPLISSTCQPCNKRGMRSRGEDEGLLHLGV